MERLSTFAAFVLIAATLFAVTSILLAPPVNADSCWDHNGSLMRMKTSGDTRTLYYEEPRAVLRRAGVDRGTVLFRGQKKGNSLSGDAFRYSRYCPQQPQRYQVSGPVADNQTRITVYGNRQVRKGCSLTGKSKRDRLVFTYRHQC